MPRSVREGRPIDSVNKFYNKVDIISLKQAGREACITTGFPEPKK